MTQQLGFNLGSDFEDPKEKDFGQVHIDPVHIKSILTKGTGFISEVDYSINPYRGCQHNCTFCFAAAFSPTPEKKEKWGKWVDAKINAPGLLRKLPHGLLTGKRVVMSSVTDPYQQAEKSYEITRDCLKILITQQPRLIIQTHGSLVTRDIDLLTQFSNRYVNISITTDCEDIRREFEPSTPSIASRLKALAELEAAGIKTRATICPMLPIKDPKRFAQKLLDTGCEHFAAQYFHDITGDYQSSTREMCLPLLKKHNWSPQNYQRTLAIIQGCLLPHKVYTGDQSLQYDKLTEALPTPENL